LGVLHKLTNKIVKKLRLLLQSFIKNTSYIKKMYKGVFKKEKGEVIGCQVGSK